VDFGCIGDVVGARVDRDNISHAHSEVPPHDLVHQDMLVLCIGLLSDECNAYSLLSFLSCDKESSTKVIG